MSKLFEQLVETAKNVETKTGVKYCTLMVFADGTAYVDGGGILKGNDESELVAQIQTRLAGESKSVIEQFNERFPVGSLCPIRTIAHESMPFVERQVLNPAFDLHGKAVAFFQGKSGVLSVEPQFVDYERSAT